MRFAGKVAAVTGGGSGIGREVAKMLVKEGASVVINGRDALKLQSVRAEIDSSGGRAAIYVGDVSSPEHGYGLVTKAEEHFGKLDILINNAGIFRPKPFLDLTEADYDSFLDIILKGKFFAAQAAAKAMLRAGGGAIVHTGSMWALQAVGATPSSAYSAANAGVHALVRNLAIELAPHNIRVNAVAPAVVETPVYETFMTAEEAKRTLPSFNSFHPLGRNGQQKDVAEAILFLASNSASWITGVVMPVDGGVMAGRH